MKKRITFMFVAVLAMLAVFLLLSGCVDTTTASVSAYDAPDESEIQPLESQLLDSCRIDIVDYGDWETGDSIDHAHNDTSLFYPRPTGECVRPLDLDPEGWQNYRESLPGEIREVTSREDMLDRERELMWWYLANDMKGVKNKQAKAITDNGGQDNG